MSPDNPAPGKLFGIDNSRLILPAILIIAALLRLVGLSLPSLSVDEGMSWLVARMPLDRIIPFILQTGEVHPPLYFYLLHFWMTAATSAVWLRFFSVLAALGALAMVWVLVRDLGGGRVLAISATIMLAFSTYAIELCREVRMYPLLGFFFLVSTWCLWRWWSPGRACENNNRAIATPSHPQWLYPLGYLLAITAAVYTHVLAALLILGQLIFVLARAFRGSAASRPGGRFVAHYLLILLLVGVLFLPWGRFLVSQAGAQDLGLRMRPGIMEILYLGFQFALGRPAGPWLENAFPGSFAVLSQLVGLIFLGLVLLGLILWKWGPTSPAAPPLAVPLSAVTPSAAPPSVAAPSLRPLDPLLIRDAGWLVGCLVVIPLLVDFLLSGYTSLRIFEYKYFAPFFPFFIITLAWPWTRPGLCVNKKWLAGFMGAMFLLLNLYTWQLLVFNPLYQGQNWRLAATVLNRFCEQDDLVLIQPSMMQAPFLYYYRGRAPLKAIDLLNEEEMFPAVAGKRLVWLVTTPHHPLVIREASHLWFDRHLRQTGIRESSGVYSSDIIRILIYRPKDPLIPGHLIFK